jgi:AraC-like DNA-binding protein
MKKTEQAKERMDIRFWRSSKIFMTILKSILLIVPVPIIVMIMIELVSLHLLEKTVTDFEGDIMKRVQGEIDLNFQEATRIMIQIKKDARIAEYVKADERDYYEEKVVCDRLMEYVTGHDNIEDAYVYFPDHDLVLSTLWGMDSFTYHQKYYKNSYDEWLSQISSGDAWRGKFKITLGKDLENRSILASSIGGSRARHSAQVVVQLKNDYLKSLLREFCTWEGDEAFLYSDDGMILSTYKGDVPAGTILEELRKCREEGTSVMKLQESSYTVQYVSSSKTGMTLVYASSKELSHTAVSFIKKFGILIVCGCTMLLIFLAFAVARKNYKPIKHLNDMIKNADKDMDIHDYEDLETYVENSVHIREEIKHYEEDIKHLYLGRILFRGILTPPSYRKAVEWGFHLEGGHFTILLFVLDFKDEVQQDPLFDESSLKNSRVDILDAYMKEVYAELDSVYILEEKDNIYCILNWHGMEENAFEDMLERKNAKLKKTLSEMEGMFCDIYASDSYMSLGEIHQGYRMVNQRRDEKMHSELYAKEKEDGFGVEAILEIISQNISDVNLSISVIADQLGITSSYLSRFFKQKMGMGMLEYIHQSRIEQAKEILRSQKELRVKEVAGRTGFYNISTFIRVFKKIVGVTPGEYREVMLEDEVLKSDITGEKD